MKLWELRGEIRGYKGMLEEPYDRWIKNEAPDKELADAISTVVFGLEDLDRKLGIIEKEELNDRV